MKNQLLTSLYLVKAWLTDDTYGDSERGATVEVVVWAVALFALATMAAAALTAFVTSQLAKLG